MAKDNKALYLVGGAVIAYLLVPKDVKDKVGDAINIQLPEFGGYDFSNLLGGITQAGGGLLPAIEMPDLDIAKLIAGIPQVIPEATLPNIEELIRGMLPIPEGAKEGVTPIKTATPKGTTLLDFLAGLSPFAQNVVVGGVTGIAGVAMWKGAPLISTVVKNIGQVTTPFASRVGQFLRTFGVKTVPKLPTKLLTMGKGGGLALFPPYMLYPEGGKPQDIGFWASLLPSFARPPAISYESSIQPVPEGEWGEFTPSTPAIPEGEYGVSEGGYGSPSGYAAATYGWAEGMGF